MWSEFIFQAGMPGESALEFVIKQPTVTLFILFNYVYFVKRCGPEWMKNRPAYDLRSVIIAYNVFQIIANLYMTITAYGYIIEASGHILNCIPEGGLTKAANYLYIYNKYLDLIETLIFVLRKKQSQISFLHVYHHVAVIALPTILLYTNPGGMVTLCGMMNCLVHVIMYMYYLMTNLMAGQRALLNRLKPRITEIQLIQFFLATIHFLRVVFGWCDTSMAVAWVGLSQTAVFFVLFSNFYRKQYLTRKTRVN